MAAFAFGNDWTRRQTSGIMDALEIGYRNSPRWREQQLVSLGDDQIAEVQQLIDRVNQGDEAMRMVLIDRTYERLRQLSALILRKNFPRLKEAPTLVDTTDVAHESAYRLYHALAEIRPTTVRDYFRLAAQRIRWLLLDLARAADRTEPVDRQSVENFELTPRSDPPAVLAALDEQIEALPAHEREVVDLIYFYGLSQAETATQMGVTERTVRRYWTVARLRLFEALKEKLPPAAGTIANGLH
jgi:RNA polymerase sigma factor (sigma-70 family)